MFQYTNEVIINSNNGRLNFPAGEGGTAASNVKFAAVNDAGEVVASGATQLMVDGVATPLKGEFICAAYRRAQQDAHNEVIEITIPADDLEDGMIVRLQVNAYQQGMTSSNYADAQRVHVKSFNYEIKYIGGDGASIATQFADVIEKEMSMTDFKYFKAEGDGAVLTLTADDCYTRFATINVAIVPIDKAIDTLTREELSHVITGYQDYVAIVDWKRVDGETSEITNFEPGTEGNGTVARLIKNMRIPTSANADPFGLNMGGKPVPGGKYDQFCIEYVTDRRHIGGQVMGALDKSITTHIFFVESAEADNFADAISAVLVDPMELIAVLDATNTAADPDNIVNKAGSKQ